MSRPLTVQEFRGILRNCSPDSLIQDFYGSSGIHGIKKQQAEFIFLDNEDLEIFQALSVEELIEELRYAPQGALVQEFYGSAPIVGIKKEAKGFIFLDNFSI